MAEWIYRATAKRANWGATVDSLTDYNFLCRTAYTKPNKKTGINQLVANVLEVKFGDVIHIAFSSDGGYEQLGSFEILDTDHPDQEGPIDHAKHGRLSLFRASERSPLGQMLAGTTFKRDPKLGAFTGWHVREVECPEIGFIPEMFPGNNALHRFTPGQAAPPGSSLPGPQALRTEPLAAAPRTAGASITLPKTGRFIGVDWSGAAQAGQKVWAAAVYCSERNPPKLEFVRRPFVGFDAAGVATRFANWLASEPFVAAGLDFCFGVSRSHLVKGLPRTGPADLGRWIAENYPTPQDFKVALGREGKRVTDRKCGSPFAPTNLRMFRQAYWGLRALAKSKLSILPWDAPLAEGVVVEILPAHIVKALCPNCRYKGTSSQAKLERQRLLAAIIAAVGITISADNEQTLLNDSEGDALDAVLAAIAAAAAKESGFAGVAADSATSGEGWIYSVGQ